MHFSAAEFFTIDILTNGCFDKRWSSEVQATSFCHEQHITEHWQVATTCNTVAHDRSNLRDAISGDHRVVPEDSPKVIGIGEHIFL